jgi:hypothetical protein
MPKFQPKLKEMPMSRRPAHLISSFTVQKVIFLLATLMLAGCATDRAGAELQVSGKVQAVMTVNGIALPLKYAYAVRRPSMDADKKRLGVKDDFSLAAGDVGLVVIVDRKLSSAQLSDITRDQYRGSDKIKGFVLTFATQQTKLYETTFLAQSGAIYLYGFTSSGAEIKIQTENGQEIVTGQAIFNNQDATGSHGYQLSFELPWTQLHAPTMQVDKGVEISSEQL